jgi:hypothetical protein
VIIKLLESMRGQVSEVSEWPTKKATMICSSSVSGLESWEPTGRQAKQAELRAMPLCGMATYISAEGHNYRLKIKTKTKKITKIFFVHYSEYRVSKLGTKKINLAGGGGCSEFRCWERGISFRDSMNHHWLDQPLLWCFEVQY